MIHSRSLLTNRFRHGPKWGVGVCLSIATMLTIAFPAFADNYEMGLRFYNQGNYTTASRFFLDAVGEGQNNPNIHYYLADSYLKLHRLAEAQAEYQKILSMAPDSQAARLSRLGLSQLKGYLDNTNSDRWRKAGGKGSGDKPDKYVGAPINGEDYLDEITDNGKRVRWSLAKMPLKVFIEQSPQGIRNFQPAFPYQIRRALDVWTDVLGHQLSYQLVTNKEQADIRVTWTNSIDTRGHSGDGGTAYTAGLMVPNLRDDRIDYMDVKIATFDIKGNPQTIDTIYAVGIHELGHSLGLLGHSENPNDIMYAENQHVVVPSERDKNTLRKLYTLQADIDNVDATLRKVDPNRESELADKLDEAITKQEEQAKQDGMALSWLNLGVAYYQKGRQGGPDAKSWLEKSLGAISKAISMEPKDPRAYHRRSLVYQELGDYPKALQDIQKSISLDYKEPEYLMLQAWYLSNVGRMGEARASLDAYLRAKPAQAGSTDVKQIQEKLSAGK